MTGSRPQNRTGVVPKNFWQSNIIYNSIGYHRMVCWAALLEKRIKKKLKMLWTIAHCRKFVPNWQVDKKQPHDGVDRKLNFSLFFK
jgi:hypothetical protein